MRLHEFVPIDDQIVDRESLIERVFEPEFCVVDECGHLLTSKHNQNLLHQAKVLIEQFSVVEPRGLQECLLRLRARAEIVRQSDYDLAVCRELRDVEADYGGDYSLRSGSLL